MAQGCGNRTDSHNGRSVYAGRATLFKDHAALHDELNMLHDADVSKRIPSDANDIGVFADFQRADIR